jgi:hypothetical protein
MKIPKSNINNLNKISLKNGLSTVQEGSGIAEYTPNEKF